VSGVDVGGGGGCFCGKGVWGCGDVVFCIGGRGCGWEWEQGREVTKDFVGVWGGVW